MMRPMDIPTHLVQAVAEGIVGSGSGTQYLPVIYDQFMTTWGSLAFGDGLQSSDKLDRRFQGESQSSIRLALFVV